MLYADSFEAEDSFYGRFSHEKSNKNYWIAIKVEFIQFESLEDIIKRWYNDGLQVIRGERW